MYSRFYYYIRILYTDMRRFSKIVIAFHAFKSFDFLFFFPILFFLSEMRM